MNLSSSASRALQRMSTKAKPDVLFSFGAIADVQCGELDDRLHMKPHRYYRNALNCLWDAVDSWNRRKRAPSFILQLGDVLDGFNILRGGKEQAFRVLQDVMEACERFKGDFHHVWGNHELYNFTRLELLNGPLFSGRRHFKEVHPDMYNKQLTSKLTHPPTPSDGHSNAHLPNGYSTAHLPNEVVPPFGNNKIKSNIEDSELVFMDDTLPVYYDFSPCKGYRFVLLDTYDVSTLGYREGSQEVSEALGIIRKHNMNEDVRDFKGLIGLEKRFVSFNGGVGKDQLLWLKRVLDRAKSLQERVIVFGHVPVYPQASLDFCLVWNYAEVLQVLRSSGSVVATFSGHTHLYQHRRDEAGIHHIVLPGIVECQPGTNGYATFDVRADSMTMHGVGKVPTLTFNFEEK